MGYTSRKYVKYNRNIVIQKNNKIIEENKNIFTKIGIINNINYSKYSINEDGDIKTIKGKLRKQYINDGYSCIMLKGVNCENIKEIHSFKVHKIVT